MDLTFTFSRNIPDVSVDKSIPSMANGIQDHSQTSSDIRPKIYRKTHQKRRRPAKPSNAVDIHDRLAHFGYHGHHYHNVPMLSPQKESKETA